METDGQQAVYQVTASHINLFRTFFINIIVVISIIMITSLTSIISDTVLVLFILAPSRTQLGDGNVENICLVPTFGLVLVAGQNFLHFFYLDRERHYWERLGKGTCSCSCS